jgi:CubicO group peptidase (beta-lactamase class C family)
MTFRAGTPVSSTTCCGYTHVGQSTGTGSAGNPGVSPVDRRRPGDEGHHHFLDVSTVVLRMASRVRVRPAQVQGDVAPGFGRVADVFGAQLARGQTIGAACAVYRDGQVIVDLWGGKRDGEKGLPWESDTLVPVFSTTKGMASMAIAVEHSRGHLDFEERVASYWPEFAQNGKGEITVRQLLSHQAGLAALDEPIRAELLADADALAPLLARQAPLWEPGTRQGYHAVTLGLYASELLRRVDPAGRTIGRAFAENVAQPLGIEFYIGLPDDLDDHRLARFHGVHPARGLFHIGAAPARLLLAFCNPRSLTSRAFKALPFAQHPERINDRHLLRQELASFGGVGNARGIARAYGELATGGRQLELTLETVAAFEAPVVPPPGGRRDLVLHSDMPFTLGFGPAGSPASPSVRTSAATRWPVPVGRSAWPTPPSGSASHTRPTAWASGAPPTRTRSRCAMRCTGALAGPLRIPSARPNAGDGRWASEPTALPPATSAGGRPRGGP